LDNGFGPGKKKKKKKIKKKKKKKKIMNVGNEHDLPNDLGGGSLLEF
jgi:hypothetical protein